MRDGSILDLGLDPRFAPAPAGGRRGNAGRVATLALLVLLAGCAFAVSSMGLQPAMRSLGLAPPEGRAMIRIDLAAIPQVEELNVDDKAQIVVEGEIARERNAGIPTLGLPVEHVAGFTMAGANLDTQLTALRCLTQAVYYEAAVEPLQGRRAVAQVVLNRMRHPAYPKSVCGVVYQGSQRRTGCQFSFTCDGSLLRAPSPGPWREAQRIAQEALAGYVEASVGTATHYHADYVLPKWAFQLGKITQLGRHIFYRFNNGWGRAGAFSGRYAGLEQIPSFNYALLKERSELDGAALAEAAATPGLTVAPHVTDRHAANDIGGRLDVTKEWRLSIPDPVNANSRYREVAGGAATPAEAKPSHVVLAPAAEAEANP